ncbi:uncharacterized protein F4812DRAFT_462859 [Daldinia caldariorum]|uniref:uncharacterized protein n=1 Tax=Daldinia caldariorum TaxID=326644 RepID=UPI002007C199|nr:uncharacterized protein F4812DRAFT_462859 [Daldinia caldariorum]KAI1464439.1 hypothetical protein F4812DRAFT_462859 [Daldinia caldariorum]
MHSLHVLHGDAKPRNIIYDPDQGKVMILDFERTRLVNKKSLPTEERKQGPMKLASELESALDEMDKCIKERIRQRKYKEEWHRTSYGLLTGSISEAQRSRLTLLRPIAIWRKTQRECQQTEE